MISPEIYSQYNQVLKAYGEIVENVKCRLLEADADKISVKSVPQRDEWRESLSGFVKTMVESTDHMTKNKSDNQIIIIR